VGVAMLLLVVTLGVVLLGSALCSATEVALLRISPLRLRQLASEQHPQAIVALRIREQINRPIAGIVILNNLFNIVGSVMVGNQAAALFSPLGLGIFRLQRAEAMEVLLTFAHRLPLVGDGILNKDFP